MRAVSIPAVTIPQRSAAPPILEWWQREKVPPKGPPGGPKPPSKWQWLRLSNELTYTSDDGVPVFPSRATILSWVRFANAYNPGPYTSIHFVEAIDLIIRDRNTYGTSADLIAFSSGVDLPPPQSRWTKGKRAAGFSPRRARSTRP